MGIFFGELKHHIERRILRHHEAKWGSTLPSLEEAPLAADARATGAARKLQRSNYPMKIAVLRGQLHVVLTEPLSVMTSFCAVGDAQVAYGNLKTNIGATEHRTLCRAFLALEELAIDRSGRDRGSSV